MGLFKSIKKAFKKVTGFVKKTIKKTVGAVKKVAKKISKSKILKALAIAAAIVVTGGAAIGAFGGNLATTQFGSWMVGASQKVLGGTLFGTVKTGQPILNLLKQTGNFASKMVAKPFGAVGSTIGNVAGGATDLLGITDKASRMGYMVDPTTGKYVVDSSKTFQDAGRGYFTDDLSGQTLAQTKAGNLGTIGVGKVVDPNTGRVVQGTITGGVVNPSNAPQGMSTGQILKQSAISSGFGLATTAVANKYFSEDPKGSADSLFLEGQTPLDPIRVYASQNNINVSDIYSNPTYGTGDPYYAMNASLFSQDTIGTPTATVTGEYNV
jgi:hypothetical protein